MRVGMSAGMRVQTHTRVQWMVVTCAMNVTSCQSGDGVEVRGGR